MKVVTDFSDFKKYLDERFDAMERKLQSIEERVYLEPEKLHTIDEVVETLNTTRQTVNNLMKSGKLRNENISGIGRRISSYAILELRRSGWKPKHKKIQVEDYFVGDMGTGNTERGHKAV